MGWLSEAWLVVLVALLVAPLAYLYARRRWLSSRGGVFDCGMRLRLDRPGWMLGLARYEGDALEWYRVFSMSPRPKLVARRGEIEMMKRRQPTDVEALALYDSSEVVQLRIVNQETRQVELAMTTDSMMGMLSWLEAGPRLGHLRYPGGE
ncbi:MAG: DUF2550 domain-containing protein [Propionibacteriaceae bacterium]|nr:DUF2550 domain-containing protein [Propionibacteriaceae bacterium]